VTDRLNAALEAVVATGLDELGVSPATGVVAALAAFARLVAEWGTRMNLTGHRDAEAVVRRLVLDAAALQVVLPSYAKLADLGSGAGFPGIPMAILDPSQTHVLVEARERRHHFQRHAVRELGLENVDLIRGRLEAVEPVECDAVIAQAVAPPAQLLAGMRRWATAGGFLCVPGGTSPREPAGSADLVSSESLRYQVPLGGAVRTAWVGRI
jgi:16S rRNA (guanine527-N7)-methyltransferase